jgi:hypothetical protein
MDLSHDLNHAAAAAAMSAAVADSRSFGPCVDLYGRAIAAAGNSFMAAATSSANTGYGCYFRRAPVATTPDSYDQKSPSASFSSGDESCGSGNSAGGYNDSGRRRRADDDLMPGSVVSDQVMRGTGRQDHMGIQLHQQHQLQDNGAGSDAGPDYDDDNDRDRSASSTGGHKKHKAQKQVCVSVCVCARARVKLIVAYLQTT